MKTITKVYIYGVPIKVRQEYWMRETTTESHIFSYPKKNRKMVLCPEHIPFCENVTHIG
jgi:hypothetical protein